jgi:hypothetical protein
LCSNDICPAKFSPAADILNLYTAQCASPFTLIILITTAFIKYTRFSIGISASFSKKSVRCSSDFSE